MRIKKEFAKEERNSIHVRKKTPLKNQKQSIGKCRVFFYTKFIFFCKMLLIPFITYTYFDYLDML
jgi:hypothetical protein